MYVCGTAANKLLHKNQEEVFWLMHKQMNKKIINVEQDCGRTTRISFQSEFRGMEKCK